MLLLAQAIPDPSGCALGWNLAMLRCSSPMTQSVTDAGMSTAQTDVGCCCQLPTGQFGLVYLPQSGTTCSCFQSFWQVGSRRAETSRVLQAGFELMQEDKLIPLLAPGITALSPKP